ncbi:MAG TPA: glycosyltransferase family 39 protein [Syntrophorhabdus sp.]|jgi:4-amino-4-deoxy-L-arabinose transferase-like glycosyltransferase|nr:glycosyltransferase family 39 protein [Syntrophorhabdus sp.]
MVHETNYMDSQQKVLNIFPLPWIIVLLSFTIIIRLPVLFIAGIIHNDSYEYIRAAKSMLQGDWTGGVAPPVYSFCIMVLNKLVGNYELAGVLVSWIFGAAVAVPIYFFARKVFDERTGKIASLLSVVQPTLYFYSGSVLSDSVYYFFIALSVYLGWMAFEKGKLITVVLFSLSTTISYLTRPEAIGFMFIFFLWILLINPPGEKRNLLKRLTLAVTAIIFFIIFSSPYLVALRKEFGRWEISRKASISIEMLEKNTNTIIQQDKETESGPGIPTNKRRISIKSIVREPVSISKKLLAGFVLALFKYQQALNPVLFLLALVGFVRRRHDRTLWRIDLYILSYFFFFFAIVLPFFWVTKRHTSHLIVIALPWAAYGLIRISDFVRNKTTIAFMRNHVGTIFLIFIMVILFTQGVVERMNSRKHRVIRKEVGIWMKNNLQKGPVISRLPHEAFYGDMDWINVQDYSYDNLLEKATDKQAKYLIIDMDVMADNTNFVNRLKENNFDLIYVKQKRNQKIFVFSFQER